MHQLRLQVLFVGDVALTEEERKREEERKEEIKEEKLLKKVMEAMKRAEEERRNERKKNQSTIYTAEEVNYQFLAACWRWLEGKCHRGDGCDYRHGHGSLH